MTMIHVHEGCAYIGNPPEMRIKNAVHLDLQARTKTTSMGAWRYQETLAVFYQLFHSHLASSLKAGVVMVTNSHCVLLVKAANIPAAALSSEGHPGRRLHRG